MPAAQLPLSANLAAACCSQINALRPAAAGHSMNAMDWMAGFKKHERVRGPRGRPGGATASWKLLDCCWASCEPGKRLSREGAGAATANGCLAPAAPLNVQRQVRSALPEGPARRRGPHHSLIVEFRGGGANAAT